MRPTGLTNTGGMENKDNDSNIYMEKWIKGVQESRWPPSHPIVIYTLHWQPRHKLYKSFTAFPFPPSATPTPTKQADLPVWRMQCARNNMRREWKQENRLWEGGAVGNFHVNVFFFSLFNISSLFFVLFCIHLSLHMKSRLSLLLLPRRWVQNSINIYLIFIYKFYVCVCVWNCKLNQLQPLLFAIIIISWVKLYHFIIFC